MLARGESPEAVLEQLAHGLTQKYLHGPLAALNRSEGEDRKQLLAWMPRLFPGRDSAVSGAGPRPASRRASALPHARHPLSPFEYRPS